MEQSLGKRIVYHRKRLHLTQDQLAEKLGVTAQAVSKWENDQSCPDISTLPQLAGIFGITTDELLGYQAQVVHEGEVIDREEAEPEGIHGQKGNWEFQWNGGKRSTLGFAVLALLVGGLYLASSLLHWGHSFWDILWPSCFFVFGIWGLFPRLSFFRLGCTLWGGYSLLSTLFSWNMDWEKGVFWALVILLLGLSLLADGLRKSKGSKWRMRRSAKGKQDAPTCEYSSTETTFSYSASFGAECRRIALSRLEQGNASVCFGEYTLDLTSVEEVAPGCTVELSASFGELTVLVPRCFGLKPDSSTAFASVRINGSPDAQPRGTILLDASASFGQIVIEYV